MVALAMINQDARVVAFSSDDERWEAVRRRDKSADGRFYYSVRTDGRPSGYRWGVERRCALLAREAGS